MKLQLDDTVLKNHRQLFPQSCVTMGVELVLKLMKAMPANSFDLQHQYGNVQKSGDDYHDMVFYGVKMQKEFGIPRGSGFPLNDLFARIKSELNDGNFVNCAWRPNSNVPYHAYVIYGYQNTELFATTYNYGNPKAVLISDMGTRLSNIEGSDIITFTIL